MEYAGRIEPRKMKRGGDKPPAFLKRYFWDVGFDRLDRRRVGALIIERILEYGDPRAVRWMQRCFDDPVIREVVKRSRSLSARSANFWALRYHVERREVRCLSSSFQRRRAQHWFA